MPNHNQLLNINEAAKILRVSAKTLRRWEIKGVLKPQRTSGGHRRYLLPEIYAFKKQKGSHRITKKLITGESNEPLQNRRELRFENILLPQTKIDIKDLEFRKPEEITSASYQFIPKPQKNVFRLSLAFLIIFILIYTTTLSPGGIKLLIKDNKISQKISSLIQKENQLGEIEKLKEALVKEEMSKVLAATSFTNVSFGVNVLSNFNEDANFAGNIAANGGSLTTTSASFNLLNTTATTLNIGGDATTLSVGATTGTTSVNNTLNLVGNTLTSADDLTIDPGGGGVKIGTGTQGIVDLTGDDLYVTGDLELDGSLVVGSDSVNDLTGTGLQVSSGSLQATLGTSIESSEISDSTIQEVDLNASNSPTSGYTLTYNSSTSGFTWTDLASSTTIWTDSGTTTYLTTTTDELVLGGSSPLSSAKFSIDGDTDQIQLLLQANSTQTSNVFVIENSAGSDIFSVNNDGLATWTRTSAGQWVSFDDGTDQWGLYNRAGTPEGFITANTGTLAMDTANGTLYVKTDDGDATDWVNLATGVSSPFTSSGGIIDKTTVNDRLRLQYGEATDTQFEINNTTLATAPTADAILINLTGGSGIATDGIDGIYLNLEATDITGGGTVRGLAVDLDTVGSPSGDETFVGLDIAALNTATSATEYALRIGNTWDANLVLADTTSFVKLANGGTLTIEDDSAADGVDLLTLVDAGAITIGSSATTQLVISTDSTGDTEIQLPNDSIATAEILDNTITATDLAATLTFTDGDLLDLDAINVSSNAEGIFLPQATACSSGTANGQICWDNDTFALYVGNGTGVTLIGGTGGGDITAVGNITSGDAFTSGTPGSELYFATAGFLGLGSSTGRITFTDATPDVIDIEAANLDINTNTLSGTTAVINFDDFDVDADGNVILAPDALSDALTITLPNAASRGIVVDAATNDNNLNSTTQGVINLAVDAAITAASATNNGIFVDYEALDDTDASDTFNALTIALTSTTGDADTLYGINFPDFTAGTATETGIHFGAGWNNLLEIEGTAGDGFQTFIQATAPTADRIYTLPDTTDSTFCMSSGNCAGGAGGSKWTDSGTVTYLTNTTDDLVVGASAVTGAGEKISFQGDEDEILLLLQGNATQTSNIILVEQDGGTDLFTLSNSGLLSTSDLTLGLNDTSATISTNDTDEDLTLDPNGNGNITLTAPTVTLSGTTTLTASSLATFTTAATLGMASTSTLNCADCIDWDDIKDATTLDTATTIASIVTATSLDLNVSPAGTAASPIAFEITPTWGIDVTDQTLIGLNINPATNSNTDPDDVLYGIQLADITATAGTETAVRIGAAYDNLFEIEGTAGDGFQTFIRTSAPTADRIYTLPDTTDSTFCMSSGNCAGGAGGSKWTDDGAVTYLTSQTDNLAVGGTDSTSEFFIDIANGGTLTLNSTGDTENIFDINANSLTTGSGIDVSSTATAFNGELLVLNKTGASGSTSFTSDITNITYSQTFSSTGTSNTGNVIDISRSYTIDDGTVGAISGTVSGAVATFSDNCAVGTADTCTNTANILSLTQNYASATGAIIEITNAGTGADISLDNDATITNTTNGDISLAENSLTFTLDFDEVASRIKLESASEVELESTSNTASAIVLDATAGGIDITSASGTDGEDIDITSTGATGQIFISSASTDDNAITIDSNTDSGGIRLIAGDNEAGTPLANGNDIEFLAEDDVIINLTAAGNLTIDAEAIDSTGTAGIIDIDLDSAPTGDAAQAGINIDVETITDAASVDTIVGLDILATQTSTDNDLLYGIRVQNLAGLADSGNEYGIYQAGTSWDRGALFADSVQLGENGADGQLVLFNELGGTDFNVTFNLSDTQGADITYILPPDDGAADNYVLTTNGGGTLNWEAVSGAGGLTGSGTDKQIAFFNTATNVTSETAGFGWDYDTNRLTVTGLTTETTGTLATLTSTANTITSGGLLSASLTQAAATGTSVTSDIGNLSFSPTYSTAVTTPTISGNVLDLSRTSITNTDFVSTLAVSGAVLSVSDSSTQTTGALTNTANILSLTQNYASATGAIIEITNAGTGADISLDNDATITNTTNGDISLAENSLTFTLDFDEVASRIKLESASEVELESTSNTASAIVLDATAGGIDITSASGTDGEDIDITSTGATGQIFISSASTDDNAITIDSNTDSGGIRLIAGDNEAGTPLANGNDIEFLAEDDVIVNLTAAGNLTIDAEAIDSTGTAGIIDLDLDATSSQQGVNLDIETITDAGVDTLIGLDILATQTSTDDDIIYGVRIQNLVTPDAGNEYGIYQAGTSWDYGLYIEDAAWFNTSVTLGSSTGFLDLSSITHATTAISGIKLPQSDLTTNGPSSGDGFIAFDTGDNQVKAWYSGAWNSIAGASTTLKQAYDNDADGSDAVILTTSTDGDIIFQTIGGAADTQFEVTAASAPEIDMVNFTNTGFGTVTANVDTLTSSIFTATGTGANNSAIHAIIGNAPVDASDVINGVEITGFAQTTASTQNLLFVDAAPSGNTTGSLNGINIDSITADAATEYAINFGTGWDANLNFSGAGDINIVDNSTTALTMSQGSDNYLVLNTDNTNTAVTLDLPVAGSSSTTGNLFTSNVTKTINIGTGTAADTINIGTGGTTADALTFGNTGVATTFDFNSGAATVDAMDLAFDSITSVNAIDLSVDALTTGVGFNLQSTSTNLSSGNLAKFDWSPTTWATSSGDLFRITLGQYGDTTGNLFRIDDNSSDLFKVGTAQITSAVPHQFTAAGDVSVAYDINFTNQTAAQIESYGPFSIVAGESFENNNLTLKTYGTGNVILDPASTGYVQLEGATRLNSEVTLADDATPDVSAGSWFVTGGTTTITDFDAGSGALEDGHIIFVKSEHTVQITCIASTELNCGGANLSLTSGDLVSFIYNSADDIWYLINFMDQGGNQAGTDIAEYFPSTQTLLPGEVVKVDPENAEHVIKSASAYESRVVGIVSTNPGIVMGQNNGSDYPVALAGRVPVKISASSEAITPGDYLTTSTDSGMAMKATGNGRVIGQALEPWSANSGKETITVFINNSWYENLGSLNAEGDIKLAEDPQNPGYKELKDRDGNLIDKLSGITSLIVDHVYATTLDVAGNIKAGYIEVNQLISDQVVSRSVKTQEIVPLEGEKDVAIKIGNSTSTSLSTSGSSTSPEPSGFGKLLVQNSEGETVASIDEKGNAQFNGQVISNELSVTSDATISGELRADRIVANEIVGLDAKLADIKANTVSGMTREEVEALLNEAESNQYLLTQSQDWTINTASGSGSLNEFALENLYVTGTAAINSLSVTENLVLGPDLVISSTVNQLNSLTVNSIDTLSAPLSIQPSASQPLFLMAGLVQIDTQGNVQIAGNLAVGGTIESSGLTLKSTSEVENSNTSEVSSGFGKLLSLVDEGGGEVASISASGSAEFKALTTDTLAVREDPEATSSATFTGIVYSTNSSAGQARIPSGSSEVVIRNPNVKVGSLVFVTPTSATSNFVLYVKEQVDGEILVGMDSSASADISFNWWIVQVDKQANAQ